MNTNTYIDTRYYRLSSLYLAAFLFSKGLELVNIDTTVGSKKAVFVFNSPDRAEELVHHYNFAQENSLEIMVDVRKFIFAVKSLKEKLYQFQD